MLRRALWYRWCSLSFNMSHGSNGKVIENPHTKMSKATLQRCVMWFWEEDMFPGIVPETGPAKSPPESPSSRRQRQINLAIIMQANCQTMTCIMRIIHRHRSFTLIKSCMHGVGHTQTTCPCLSCLNLNRLYRRRSRRWNFPLITHGFLTA